MKSAGSARWRSLKNADRVRKKVVFTLSPEAIARLDECAPRGMRSEFVERLILAYSPGSGVGESR